MTTGRIVLGTRCRGMDDRDFCRAAGDRCCCKINSDYFAARVRRAERHERFWRGMVIACLVLAGACAVMAVIEWRDLPSRQGAQTRRAK